MQIVRQLHICGRGPLLQLQYPLREPGYSLFDLYQQDL